MASIIGGGSIITIFLGTGVRLLRLKFRIIISEELDLHYENSGLYVDLLRTLILSGFPNITQLLLQPFITIPQLSLQEWSTLFDVMPSLQVLTYCLKYGSTGRTLDDEFIQALCRRKSPGLDDGESFLCCPSLSVLKFRYMDPSFCTYINSLTTMLRERHENGVPLSKISLVNCYSLESGFGDIERWIDGSLEIVEETQAWVINPTCGKSRFKFSGLTIIG